MNSVRRSACLLMIGGISCGLAPEAPIPAPLLTIEGDLGDLDNTDVDEAIQRLQRDGDMAGLRVALSWFRFRNSTQGVPPWIVAESEVVGGSSFSLSILRPPPPDALFEVSEDGLQGAFLEAGAFAVGALSVIVGGPDAQWTSSFPGDDASLVPFGNENDVLVVYWAGSGPVELLGLDDQRPIVVDVGVTRLEPQRDAIWGETYVPRASDDAFIDPTDDAPTWAFCDPTRMESFIDVAADDFDDWPAPGTVECTSCGDEESFETTCAVAFGVLCQRCSRFRVTAAADAIGDYPWPCAPEGRDCPFEGAAFCGAGGIQYECIEDQWVAVCEDCCERACEDDG